MYSKRKLVWNGLIYSFKSVLGILFPLITFPYVSNILGPTNIGKVEYANSITNYFIYVAALGITTYAVREGAKVKDNIEALSKLSAELLLINAFSSAVAYIGIIIVCKLPLFSEYSLLILINSFIILFQTIGMEWVYNVKEEFTFITIRYIVMQILAIIFLFYFVKTPDDYYYYAIYIVLTTCGSNIINIFCLKKHINIFKCKRINVRQHIKPVLLLFSISITATIFSNLDTTMLGIMSGESEVGIYQAGLKIDKIITNLLASLSLVVFSRSSYLLKDGDLSEKSQFKHLVNHFNGILMLIAAPITIGLFAVGRNITAVLLSEEYTKSGIVLMIIAGNVLLSAVGRIYGHQILIATKHDNQYFWSTLMALIIDMSLNLILIPKLGAIGTAISTVIACFISNIYVMYCAAKLTTITNMISEMMKYILISMPFLIISWIIDLTSFIVMVKLLLTVVSCVVYYLLVLLYLKDLYLKEIISIVCRKRKYNAK